MVGDYADQLRAADKEVETIETQDLPMDLVISFQTTEARDVFSAGTNGRDLAWSQIYHEHADSDWFKNSISGQECIDNKVRQGIHKLHDAFQLISQYLAEPCSPANSSTLNVISQEDWNSVFGQVGSEHQDGEGAMKTVIDIFKGLARLKDQYELWRQNMDQGQVPLVHLAALLIDNYDRHTLGKSSRLFVLPIAVLGNLVETVHSL